MICPKCRQLLPEDSEFCQYCGSRLHPASAPENNVVPSSVPELAGKTCPFCKAPFMEGEAVVFCSHCEMPHHLECWKENGGCTTFGCTGNIGKIIGAEQKNAQSAPVAIKQPAHSEAPKTIAFPQVRTGANDKHHVEQPAPAAPVRVDPQIQYIVLAENEEKVLQGNLPVLLEKTILQKDNNGKVSAVCIFRSIADKTIQAMQIDVNCADIWRESIKPVEGHQYLDLRVARDVVFGDDVRIAIPDSNTRVVDVIVKKIMFSDGTLLLREGENLKIPELIPLKKTLGEELFDEYKCQTYPNASYEPTRIGAFWRCTCGALNHEKEENCHSCQDSFINLTDHLDTAILQKSIEEKKRIQKEREEELRKAHEEAMRIKREKEILERKEREERLRLQREREAAEAAERARIEKERAEKAAAEAKEREEKRKARNKKVAIISAIAAVIVLVVYVIGWQIIPSTRYKEAETALAAGDYETAYAGFVKAGSYRDSKARSFVTRYEQGKSALESGDYDTAYACFVDIRGYEDSDTMAKEALYQKAEKLMNKGDYSSAKALYEQVKGYKKSAARIAECNKELSYAEAMELFNSGKYEESGKVFEVLNYHDSIEYAQKAFYLYSKQLIEQGKLHEAYTVLTEKVNKGGKTSYEDSADLANVAEYQYATACMSAENYETAYASFGNIKGYEDSSDLYLEAGYQFALQLFEKKSYESAASVFSSLEKYKDSVKQANESKYQYALSLRTIGKYTEAEKVFSDLGKYGDSAKQVQETKYQNALSLQQQKKWAEAEKLFAELGKYSDSATQLKETKYLHAGSLVAAGKYTDAVPIYKELGKYSDSVEKWKATMWTYVTRHKNNNDVTTYEYLKELKKQKYKDSAKYYDELYTWRATIRFYTTSTSSTPVTSISRYQGYLKYEYKLTGGPPGGKINVRVYATWPGWYSDSVDKELSDGAVWYHWYDDIGATKAGKFTVKLINKSTGAVIAQASIIIK